MKNVSARRACGAEGILPQAKNSSSFCATSLGTPALLYEDGAPELVLSTDLLCDFHIRIGPMLHARGREMF